MSQNAVSFKEAGKDSEDPQLTVQVKSTEETYKVVFFEDGSGYFEDDWREEDFQHSLNLTELRTQYSTTPEELENYLVSYFWQAVNSKLDDPLLQDYSELEGHELEFVTGSHKEFDHLMQLFLLTEPDLDKAENSSVSIRCGTNKTKDESEDGAASANTEAANEEAEPHLEDWNYWSERLDILVRMALKEHRPYGYTYEYNDESGDRHSGYSLTPNGLVYELVEYVKASARERTTARRELREWLVARGEDPAFFNVDGWEKVI